MTGNVAAATSGVLSERNEVQAVNHLMCNIAEHHRLVRYLPVFLLCFIILYLVYSQW